MSVFRCGSKRVFAYRQMVQTTCVNTKIVFSRYGESHVKDKTVADRLIFNTRVQMLVRQYLYIETAHWCLCNATYGYRKPLHILSEWTPITGHVVWGSLLNGVSGSHCLSCISGITYGEYHSFGDLTPVTGIWGCPIFKWVCHSNCIKIICRISGGPFEYKNFVLPV